VEAKEMNKAKNKILNFMALKVIRFDLVVTGKLFKYLLSKIIQIVFPYIKVASTTFDSYLNSGQKPES